MITSNRGLKLTELKEYDKRLLSFVREYNAVNHFPATLNVMLENLPEIKSKSTVHLHLQKLVQMGYLKQVGKNGAYIPAEQEEVVCISTILFNKLCLAAEKAGEEQTVTEAKRLISAMNG